MEATLHHLAQLCMALRRLLSRYRAACRRLAERDLAVRPYQLRDQQSAGCRYSLADSVCSISGSSRSWRGGGSVRAAVVQVKCLLL